MAEEQYPPSPEETSNNPDDATRASEVTPFQRRPRELPRRGYEGQPRPMNPPPPPPISSTASPGRAVPPMPPLPPESLSSAYPPPAAPYQRPATRTGEYAPPAGQPYPHSAPRPRRPGKSESGLYLPWWSLVILIVVAGGGAFGLLYAVVKLSVGQNPGDQPPRFIVVTNPVNDIPSAGNNSQSPAVNPGAIPPTLAIAPTAVPQAASTQTSLPGVASGCPVNTVVEVVGTDGVPLIIREEPRQGDNIQSLAAVNERLRIIDGPQTSTAVDGSLLEWCKVEGVTVPGRLGWAARQFLAEVQE